MQFLYLFRHPQDTELEVLKEVYESQKQQSEFLKFEQAKQVISST